MLQSSLNDLLYGERTRHLLRIAGPLLLVHLLLLMLFDLSRVPILTLLLLLSAFGTFFWAVSRRKRGLKTAEILIIAASLRILLLPLPPTLSDDILRYVWDGRVVNAGFNPYLLPPESESLTELRDDLWEAMPHRQVPTVYPPLALATFSIASWLPMPMTVLKILLTAADLLACYLLILLLQHLGRARHEAIWYAWNPLVIMEIAGMGHVDALVVLSQLAAVYFILKSPHRPLWAAIVAVAGVMSKLVPLVVLPIWTRFSQRWLAFLVLVGVCLGLTALPVAISVGGVPPGLVTYGVQWEFNGPLFEPLWRLYEVTDFSDRLKLVLDSFKQSTGHHAFWNRFYPFVYPQFLAKLTLAGLFVLLYALALWRSKDVISATGRVLGAVLLCSATFYPWYLLWVLPWAILGRHRAWIAATLLLQLSYWPQLTSAAYFPFCYLLIWGPFFILLGSSKWSID